VRHRRRHVLPLKRGKLPLALDVVHFRREHGVLRVCVFHLLLHFQDENDWFLPNVLLLWVYGDVLFRLGLDVRRGWVFRSKRVRAKDLPEHQVRLITIITRRRRTKTFIRRV
tara:strand:+ start:189 stop:524 length:336 start_codon:yes stop_codon:yes gene_type:complete